VDTGFTGDLVLPQSIIDRLELELSGSVDAILADGSQIELNTFSCSIEWFGRAKSLEIIANDGEYPLLGVGLLLGLELRIDYGNLKLRLTPN
jgi:clan AA aspartic protease